MNIINERSNKAKINSFHPRYKKLECLKYEISTLYKIWKKSFKGLSDIKSKDHE